MGAISPLHVLIVLIVALVVIGPRKLPETGAALGKALREFRDATRDDSPAVPPPVVTADTDAVTTDAGTGTPLDA